MTPTTLLSSFLLLLLLDQAWLLDNGLALKPPMGWMSWGYYMCGDNCIKEPAKCLNETLIMSVADAFYTQGYQEAGYEYIIIDDCWSEKKRDKITGRLVPDRKRFPRGMKFLADYIHSRGLKFGMYTNIATETCMHYPGSRGHFDIDAETFASWDVDYLKVDGCFVEEWYLDQAYIQLGEALNKTGRPIVYSCSWPYYKRFIHNHQENLTLASKYCNLWRVFHDVYPNFANVMWVINYFEANYTAMAPFHGPGHWNDPDMLMLGTGGLEPGQARIQMAVYAMLNAPLLISCDMQLLMLHEKKLLLNMDLLAVAQDSLGVMAKPYKVVNTRSRSGQQKILTLWVKRHMPLKGDVHHSISFALVNLNRHAVSVNVPIRKYGLKKDLVYAVLDVLESKYTMNVTRNDDLKFKVPPMDVVMYSLYPQ